jgi:hypothetical protein
MHFVVFPLSIIVAAFFIEKLSFSMTHAIEHVAFILGPHLILFSDKDSSVFEGGDWLDFDGLNNNYLRI